MKRLFRYIVLILILVVGGWWLLQRTLNLPDIRNLFRPQPILVEETPLLVKNIRAIAQLMTIEFYDEVVVDSSRNGSAIPIPPYVMPGRQSLVLVVKGRLLAGLDLSKLDSNHFSGTLDSVVIKLPQAEILEVEMNPSGVETFAEKGQWSQQAVVALAAKAKEQMLRNAASQGVLHRADEKAKEVVEQLMRNAGFNKVIIEQQP